MPNLNQKSGEHDGIWEFIENYPFPIAYHFKKIMDADGSINKLTAVFETFESVVSYLDLLVLGLYSRTNEYNPNLAWCIKKLELPNWDDWFQILKLVITKFPQSTTFIKNLQTWYESVENKKEIYIQQIEDYKKSEIENGLLSNLKQIQGNIVPVLSIMLENEITAHCNFCYSLLLKIIRELKFISNYPLYYIESDGKSAKKLVGAQRNFNKVPLNTTQNLAANHVYFYDSDDGKYISLHPFILFQECYYCIREEAKETWEILLFYGRSTSRAIYHGCIHNLALREHLITYQKILETQNSLAIKDQAIIPVKEIWERAFQATEEIIHYLRNIKIVHKYLERKYPEFALDSFSHNSQYPLFILSGERGVGKTSLLAEMARRWAAYGEIVLFFLIYDQVGLDLEKDICNSLGISSWEQIPFDRISPWNIILDGVENTSCPEKFFQNVARFANKYKQNCRIIISISERHLNLWQKYLTIPLSGNQTLPANSVSPTIAANANDNPTPQDLVMPWNNKCPLIKNSYFHLDLLDKNDLKEMYSLLSTEIAAPLTPFSEFAGHIQGMIRNPSFMTVFLHCLKNREVPKVLSFNDMLEGYVLNNIIATKPRREFIDNLIETLLKEKTTYISLDSIVDGVNLLLMKEALTDNSSSTLMELTHEGILGRILVNPEPNKKTILHFPLGILREYLIYRTLALMGKHRDELLLENIKDIAQGNDILYGVVFFAIMRLSNKQYFDRVAQLIQQSQDTPEIGQNLLLQILIMRNAVSSSGKLGDGGNEDSFINAIITNASPNSLIALADFAKYLYTDGQFSSAAFLFDKLTATVSETLGEYDPLILNALAGYSYYKAGQVNQASKLYKKCTKLLKRIEGKSNEWEFYLFMAKAHRELGEIDRCKFFFSKVYEQKEIFHDNIVIESKIFEEAGYLALEEIDYPKALRHFQKQHKLLEETIYKDLIGLSLNNIAQVYAKTGNSKESIAFFKKASELFEEIGDITNLSISQHKLGIVLVDTANFSEARIRLLKALAGLEHCAPKNLVVECYLYLGKSYEQINQEDQAKEYYTKAIDLLKELQNYQQLGQCYAKFGQFDYRKGSIDRAMSHFEKAETYYRQASYKPGLAEVYCLLGILYQDIGKFSQAISYLSDSLKLREEIQDRHGIAECHNYLAQVSGQNGNLSEAQDHLQKAKEIYQQLSHQKGLLLIQISQAALYKLQGQNSKAMECYETCLKPLESLGERGIIAKIYNNIGLIYKDRNDLYQAMEYFEKAAKHYETLGDMIGLAATYNNIGLIYDLRNEFEKALEYYNKDLQISEKQGDKRGMAMSYNNIGILNFNHNNYARALWYLEKALEIFQELKEVETITRIQERIQAVRQKL